MFDRYVDINKKFKASVNLEFDLQNEEKIEEYIPTTDLCDVIKKYINSVLGNPNFKATTLSGPYGKGKSYLLLMILYLLSKRENRELFEKVCNKIKLIDNELYNLLIKLDNTGNYLLPVVINNNTFDDLNKNFLASLSESLNLYGFSDIVPNTSYAEALKIISKWEEEKLNGFDIVNVCLDKLNLNLNDIKIGLKNYDNSSFEKFTNLYTCVSHGLEFFTMKTENIVSIFKDINQKITKKDKKCKGMFVVFDEFGSFLNNQTNDFVTRLGKIQAFAEMCNESDSNAQIHFCCITHKDILLYKKDKAYDDAFDTIAGRFDSIEFDRSMNENYQLLCSAIVKRSKYEDEIVKYKANYSELIKSISETGLFNDNQLDYIINNGYPFNPMSLYVLIQISEILAQNERTLFTFLSDTDVDGFRYFISNNNTGLLNSDIIYDYFETLIKDNDEYKMHYYKVEFLKKISIKNDEHRIFKTIALMKIINDPLRLNCTIDNIANCLAMNKSDCRNIISQLINKNILKKNINDDTIDFAIVADQKISNMINEVAETRFDNLDLGKILTSLEKNKYEISNEYNFNHKMVRFYKVIYLEASKLIKFKTLNLLIDIEIKNEYFDGLLINLVNDIKLNKEELKSYLNNSNENIIIRYVQEPIKKNVIQKIKELLAAKFLVEDKRMLSDNAVKALPLLIEDMNNEINTYLLETYLNSIVLNKIDYKEKNVKTLINKSFESYYSKTLSFNNEQINKNEVQSVSLKARNNVIDCMLKEEKLNFNTTSQEMTIYNCFVNTDKKEIINSIKDYIYNSNGEKTSFIKLISMLEANPYGMRQGIIPLFVGEAIKELSIIEEDNVDTIILYNDKVEVELNANNLSKACAFPSGYYFCYTRVNAEKILMIDKLMKEFNCKKSTSFAQDIKQLVQGMKTYVSNLSPIIVRTNNRDNLLKLNQDSINFKDLFLKVNNNNYELLFTDLPELLNLPFENIYEQIIIIKGNYENGISNLYQYIESRTKEIFDIKDGSLKLGIEEWIKRYNYIDKIVFENNQKAIYNMMRNLSFNDDSAINSLSFGCINCGIDDYNTKKQEEYFSTLNSFIDKVKNFNEETSTTKENFEDIDMENIKLSSLGKTLYSNIQESVEEYGDAISNEEKALIYKKLLSELLK